MTTIYENGAFYTFGDTENITDTLEAKAKRQVLDGVDGYANYIFGDAYAMTDARGGNDVITGAEGRLSYNILYGDAFSMTDSWGGNDVLIGGLDAAYNDIIGDADEMTNSWGGNDVLTGARGGDNYLYGDAYSMTNSWGGNDVLTVEVGSNRNNLYGDAVLLLNSMGGNDVLIGGSESARNFLCGDADVMTESQGGNDLLIAGDTAVLPGADMTKNWLYGDAIDAIGTVICGNDRLVSGTGSDQMWGDIETFFRGSSAPVTTGHDVFVFQANNGQDAINDFEQGKDMIELHGITGAESFDALADKMTVSGSDTVITFGANTITVVGVTALTAADFHFA